MSRADSICFGLLAGGQSSRMGTDKAALDWHGVPLWQYQLRLAREIGATEILISGRGDGPYREAARVVRDEISAAGPMAGISALANAAVCDWLVVVGVDMPLLEGATLREVLALRQGRRGSVPVAAGRAEALAAVYPREVAGLASRLARSANRSLQNFVHTAEAEGLVQRVKWRHPEVFRSFNTPEEWASASRG